MKFNIDSTADMDAFVVLKIGSVVEILIGEKGCLVWLQNVEQLAA